MSAPIRGAASGHTVYLVIKASLHEEYGVKAVRSSNELAEAFIEDQSYSDQADLFIEAHQVDDELA